MKRCSVRELVSISIAASFLLLGMVRSTCCASECGKASAIGVLGDSYSDEYQFYPPDRSTAQNWVEILARTRGLSFGRYSAQSRGEPRNQGYEFNWSRSDATTADLITSGQHTGLAEQVARGQVDIVVIFIGGNDFINALHSRDAATVVQSILSRALANLRLAVETILKASPHVQVLVATLPNILELPEFAGPLHQGRLSPRLAASYTAEIGRYNAEVRTFALGTPRVVLLDLALLARLAPRPDGDHVRICGRTLDRTHAQNDPDHVFLGDARHVGTLTQAVMANLVIHTLNSRFDARIKPVSVAETLDLTRPTTQVVTRDSPVLPPRPHRSTD
jgi:phospholipase/lecithinase/hemolysin